jgi:hypothetical protein
MVIPLEISGFSTLGKSLTPLWRTATFFPDEGFAMRVYIDAKSNGVSIEIVDTVEMIQEGVSYEEQIS